jgi:hypothetical protein
MNKTIPERNLDKIKVIDVSPNGSDELSHIYQCIHCKERHYLTQSKDTIHLRCGNCGGLTPTRTAKHSRGLAAPAIQQSFNETAATLVQSKKYESARDRKPKNVNDNRNKKENPLEKYLIERSKSIIDIQYDEPG